MVSGEVDSRSEVLTRTVEYSGEKMSVRSLEEVIHKVRDRQDAQVGDMKVLRERNVKLQSALADEIKKLRKLSDFLGKGSMRGSLLTNLKEVLSYIPGLRSLALNQRSIEELLRQQFEISNRRVREAADFSDKLKAAESDLFDEIERLNGRILEAAKNEDKAAEFVLELEALKNSYQSELDGSAEGSTERREIEAQLDRLRRTMSEHSTLLQLYHTCEERVGRLKENTRRLRETIGGLSSDITQYVTAASEKLDLASGQIQAIGTAADASVVMLEMKKSLDVMTDSMNQTTVFVSETQAYFRANLDNLISDLELYDDETREVMDKNLAEGRETEERRIEDAVKVALERRASGDAPQAN